MTDRRPNVTKKQFSGLSNVPAATQGSSQSFQGDSDFVENLGDSVWDVGEEEVTSVLLGYLEIPTGDVQGDAGREGQGKKGRKNKSNPEEKKVTRMFELQKLLSSNFNLNSGFRSNSKNF